MVWSALLVRKYHPDLNPNDAAAEAKLKEKTSGADNTSTSDVAADMLGMQAAINYFKTPGKGGKKGKGTERVICVVHVSMYQP